MRRWGCPPPLALLAASRAAGALAIPLSSHYFFLFDPTYAREAQGCSIGFRLIVYVSHKRLTLSVRKGEGQVPLLHQPLPAKWAVILVGVGWVGRGGIEGQATALP